MKCCWCTEFLSQLSIFPFYKKENPQITILDVEEITISAPSPPQIRSPTVALARPDTTATDRTGPRGLRPGRTPTVRLSLFIAPASSPFLKTLQHSPPPPSNLICCENHVYHSVFSRSSFAHPQSHFSLQSQTHFGFSVLPLPVFSQASLQAHFSFYFVGNLPFSVDSPQLAGLFESTRNVEMVEILILEFGFFPHFFFFFLGPGFSGLPPFFWIKFFLENITFLAGDLRQDNRKQRIWICYHGRS
jgi:hypothetical protein